jgi:Trp operon repressor
VDAVLIAAAKDIEAAAERLRIFASLADSYLSQRLLKEAEMTAEIATKLRTPLRPFDSM